MKTPKPPKKPAAPRPRPAKQLSSSSGAVAPRLPMYDTPSPREVRLRQWLWRAENPHER